MYFFHVSDGGSLVLNLTGLMSLTSSFSLGRTFLRAGISDIVINDDKSSLPASFICTSCNKEIPVGEIRGKCNNCGHTFSLDSLLKLDGSSAVFCANCIKNLEGLSFDTGSKFTKVSVIFQKVNLKK